MAQGPTNGLGRRLDALEQAGADAWVNGLMALIEREIDRSGIDDPSWKDALLREERALLERWYPVKLGLELAGTPTEEILQSMGAFLDAHEDQVAEAVRAAS